MGNRCMTAGGVLLLMFFITTVGAADELVEDPFLQPMAGEKAIGVYDATSSISGSTYRVHIFYDDYMDRFRAEVTEDGILLQNIDNYFALNKSDQAEPFTVALRKVVTGGEILVIKQGNHEAALNIEPLDIDQGRILALMQKYVQDNSDPTAGLFFGDVERAGLCRKHCVMRVFTSNTTPAFVWGKFLITESGRIEDFTFKELIYAYRREEIKAATESEHLRVAMSLIKAVEPFYRIINSVDDIPGYKAFPLESDVECTVRKPWSYKDASGNTCYIWYTYSKHSGRVTRFNIEFWESGELSDGSSCLVLGHSIGDFDIFY